jgi:flagellar biosynthesis anti-sigma factor FlgM
MRIDSNVTFSKVSTEPAQKSAGNNRARQTAAQDKTTLTLDTVSLSTLVSKVLQTPEVRQDKVDGLRQKVSSGQYHVDSAKVADALLADKRR